jgi:hypothetical protein
VSTREKAQSKSPPELATSALGHPIRFEALTIFNERVASPKEISGELHEDLNLVTYHITQLLKAECIELVRTEPRGGSHEHFYRGVQRAEISDEDWLKMPDADKREICAATYRNLSAEGLASIHTGKMSADPCMRIWWKAVNLDHEGREEASIEQAKHMERLQKIETRSNARMVESSSYEGVSTVLAVLGFTRSRSGRPDGDLILARGKLTAR